MDTNLRPLWAIGLESDTAISGIDAAIIRTDGVDIFERSITLSRPYTPAMREAICAVLGEQGQQNFDYLKQVEEELTEHHISVVKELLDIQDMSPRQIDVIGFSGHTVLNRPSQKLSVQIGNAQKMLDAFGILESKSLLSNRFIFRRTRSPDFPHIWW
jgi:anhydro-N-acetylmuramic acid kinase